MDFITKTKERYKMEIMIKFLFQCSQRE